MLTDAQRIRRLPWLIGADALNIFFISLTFAGPIFVLFLDELGLDSGQIGLLLSLVPFSGTLVLVVGPFAARAGYKRVFITGRTVRTIPIALILLTPTIQDRYGSNGAFYYVGSMILLFAILRAMGESGNLPWRNDVIPNAIRGKIAAISGMINRFSWIAVGLGAGYLIEHVTGLQSFMVLMAIGVAFGLTSALFFGQVPAENETESAPSQTEHWAGIKTALTDRRFAVFMMSFGLVIIGFRAINKLLPLFLKEHIGLSGGEVLLVEVGTHTGGLVSSYFWGWSADRYGSRPIMQVSLALMILFPAAWLIVPRQVPVSIVLAIGVAFVFGVALLAWQVGWLRYLYVNALPTDNRSAYLSVFFAWFSISDGLGPLLAGRILTWSDGIPSRSIGIINIDSYTPLFLFSALLLTIAIVLLPRLSAESNLTFRGFAGMFLHGNPLRGMRLLVQYTQSQDEITRVIATEQMGDARSPLNKDELIDALKDPSYNVRYEAIHSIGRMSPDPELTEALVAMLEGPESELGMVTARALGRLGDPAGIPALRRALHARYDLIAAESARALGHLGDTEAISDLVAKLHDETHIQLKVAYAAALGELRAAEVIPDLFALLKQADTKTVQGELGLAVARIAGNEKFYLQQWRAMHDSFETTAAQLVMTLQRRARRAGFSDIEPLLERCANSFGTANWKDGVACLEQIAAQMNASHGDEILQDIMTRSASLLAGRDDMRVDLILLMLQALDAIWGDAEADIGLKNSHVE